MVERREELSLALEVSDALRVLRQVFRKDLDGDFTPELRVPQIAKVIDGLDRAPGEQGKALVAPLQGVRSVRAVRDRFRVLYRVDARKRVVSVRFVGERAPGQEADVYALARKLLETFSRPGKGTRRSS